LLDQFDKLSILALCGNLWHSPASNAFFASVVAQEHLSGIVLVSVLVICWFLKRDATVAARNRQHVVCTVIGAGVAIVLARGLALTLPHRVRPFADPSIGIDFPQNIDAHSIISWSSFPSDHAVLFVAVAVGVIFVSRTLGILSLIYSLLFVCFPRIYFGIHYPTDVIVGAALGAGIGVLANQPFVVRRLALPVMDLEQAVPAAFYAVGFVICFQIATMFNDVRTLALGIAHLAQLR
jgi:membrane-associated phospholipid phosphatase